MLLKNRKILNEDFFKIRFGILIEGIKYKKIKSLFKFPLLLVNRIIFSMIPITFMNHSGIQIIILTEWSLFHMALLLYLKANESHLEFAVDVFNEIILHLMYYELFWFIDGGLINGTDI